MLKGEIKEGNEESLVFSLGSLLYSCLTGIIPFNESDAKTAGNLIISGKRPSIE
jgi:hypothetical protein